MTARSRGRSRGRSLLALYPRWWRDRYGDEIALILEARPPDLGARIDLLRGAFDAHLGGPDLDPAPRRAAAALIAGGAWTIAGVASVGAPTPPDWPGYLVSTLPVALVGVAASLLAVLPVSRLAWSSNRPSLEVAVVGTVAGYVLWAAALIVAVTGGPYGAVTAIAQSLAAIATVGLGLVLLRAGAHPVGEILLVAGTVMLLPTPAGWVVAGALWTGLGLWRIVDARTDDVPGVPGSPRPISR
jgi:hypothetical protein